MTAPRDVLLTAPAAGSPLAVGAVSRSPRSSSAAAPATGATTPSGCICGHTATWHARYGPCQNPGCLCSRFTRNAPAAAVTGSGA